MSRQFHSGLCLLVIVLFFCLIGKTAVASTIGPYAGQVRPGFMTGNSDVGTEANLDILIPLWGDEKRLLFFNPNFRIDDNDGNEQNIGFGYRRMSDCGHFILGGNLFYDTMRSEQDHQYHQWGVGAELLSHWVDLRANYYDPFGDTKNKIGSGTASGYYFSGYSLMLGGGLQIEEALDGFDAEVSVLVPGLSEIMETRLTATYYNFDVKKGEDLDGWRGRLEIRPVQAINLSVEYRDDDVRGSDTFFGGYLEIPFSLEKLLAGKNPFAGAGDLWNFGKGVRPLGERMTDKVIRDRHIVTASTRAEGGAGQAVVDNQMIFVNQDNPNAGNGSFENPFQTLNQAEADNRFQPGAWIYVFSSDATADTYANTHFTLLDDQVFWGQGYHHPVYGLGGGPLPILDGGYTEVPVGAGAVDPVIRLANNNEIMGFVIQHGLEGIYVDTYRTGGTADSVNIHHNIIRDNLSFVSSGSGIHISNIFDADDLGGKTLSYMITDNLIENNDRAGIYLRHEVNNGELVGTTFDTVITGNTIDNHNSTAVFVSLYVDGSDPTLIQDVTVSNRIEDNLITDSAYGIRVSNTLNARSNTEGLYVANLNSQISNTIRNNSISNYSGGHGIYVDNQINAQTYLNSLVRQARTSNLLENNVVTGESTGIFVRNFSFSGGDFNDVTTETRLVGNNVTVEQPQYTGTYGVFVSDEFHKNGELAQGPISAGVFGQANRVNDLSNATGLVTGVLLQISTRTLGSADDYATLVNLDFGGGALGSTGGNSFTGFGTGEIALKNNSLFSVAAENNWWGTTEGAIIDALIDDSAGGAVDAVPFLTAQP